MGPRLQDYFQAGYPLLYVDTASYDVATSRVLESFRNTPSVGGKHPVAFWKATHGLRVGNLDNPGAVEKLPPKDNPYPHLLHTLNWLLENFCSSSQQILTLFFNIHSYLDDPLIIQGLINLTYRAKEFGSHLVMIGPFPYGNMPHELEVLVTKVDLPLPTHTELVEQFSRLALAYSKSLEDADGTPWKASLRLRRGKQGQAKELILSEKHLSLVKLAATAAQGLDAFTAESVFSLSLVTTKTIDLDIIRTQKSQAVAKSEVLEFIQCSETMADVGGFDLLKEWIEKRSKALTDSAIEYGLTFPKGILIIGAPGLGKSLCVKSISHAMGLPLLRLDMGKVFKSYVGQSEQAMREALKVAESIAPCILQLDEIDKALSGVAQSGNLDSGVTARVVSTLLTWRQETTAQVMLVATANSIENLPSAIYRKGRMDEVFYVDLPTTAERSDIFKIHLLKKGRDPYSFNTATLAAETVGWVGSEIEAVISESMFNAFSDEEREFTTEDILEAIYQTIPQSVRDKTEIEGIREWAKGKARPVSEPMTVKQSPVRGIKKRARN